MEYVLVNDFWKHFKKKDEKKNWSKKRRIGKVIRATKTYENSVKNLFLKGCSFSNDQLTIHQVGTNVMSDFKVYVINDEKQIKTKKRKKKKKTKQKTNTEKNLCL